MPFSSYPFDYQSISNNADKKERKNFLANVAFLDFPFACKYFEASVNLRLGDSPA